MSISAKNIVQVNPGVVSGGGNPLALNGLFLTENLLMPTASVFGFANAPAVSSFFGPASVEAALAAIYFAGYANSTTKPSLMLFAPFNLAARAAFLQSGSLAALTLTQLQALAGVLTITLDGTLETSSTITLSGAISFSNAATLIQAGFSSIVPVVTWNAVNSTFTLTSPITGASSTITFATGSLAAGLKLTSATGAILSQGAVLDTPASAMNNALAVSQNWISFVTLFEPVLADKINFTIWSNSQSQQYLYLGWDTDAQAIVPSSSEPFGVVIKAAAYNGVAAISGSAADIAALIAAGTAPAGTTLATVLLNIATFVAGTIASINFGAQNGRITLAFRSQAGLLPSCTDNAGSQTLLANGYSFYGSYATAAQGFNFFYNGNMPGEFDWIQNFVNQVWLNSQLQLTLLSLLTTVGSVGYNPAGYGLIAGALQGPIAAGISFGAIRIGVVLSDAQIAEVNAAAGVDAATQITNNGYYLQILDPGAQARANNQTPIINFWYSDGGDVQQITLASIEVE